MSVTNSFYHQEPHFTVRGGCGALLRIEVDDTRSTTLDGKTTTVVTLGNADLSGFSDFRGAMQSSDGRYERIVAIAIEGLPTAGTLIMSIRETDTQFFQDLGVRSGILTIKANTAAINGQEIAHMRWTLLRGSSSPNVTPISL